MAEVVAGLSGVREQMLARVADAAIEREARTRAEAAERDREAAAWRRSANRLEAYLDERADEQQRRELDDRRSQAMIDAEERRQIQVRFDSLLTDAFGERAPPPAADDDPTAYRRRLMRNLRTGWAMTTLARFRPGRRRASGSCQPAHQQGVAGAGVGYCRARSGGRGEGARGAPGVQHVAAYRVHRAHPHRRHGQSPHGISGSPQLHRRHEGRGATRARLCRFRQAHRHGSGKGRCVQGREDGLRGAEHGHRSEKSEQHAARLARRRGAARELTWSFL